MSLESDVQLLMRVPMLSEFSEDKLRLLAFSAENRNYRAGQRLFAAGERADSAYVIVAGRVSLRPPGASDDSKATSVGTGTLIGELALIIDCERQASAFAETDVGVIQIRRPLFRRMLDEYPDVAQRLHARLAEKLGRTTGALMRVRERLDRLDE